MCPLPSLIQSIYICTEVIFRNIDGLPGTKIGGRNINNLRYTDDIVLLAETEDGLQNIVNVVNEESKKYGLLMNIKKPKRWYSPKNT